MSGIWQSHTQWGEPYLWVPKQQLFGVVSVTQLSEKKLELRAKKRKTGVLGGESWKTDGKDLSPKVDFWALFQRRFQACPTPGGGGSRAGKQPFGRAPFDRPHYGSPSRSSHYARSFIHISSFGCLHSDSFWNYPKMSHYFKIIPETYLKTQRTIAHLII